MAWWHHLHGCLPSPSIIAFHNLPRPSAQTASLNLPTLALIVHLFCQNCLFFSPHALYAQTHIHAAWKCLMKPVAFWSPSAPPPAYHMYNHQQIIPAWKKHCTDVLKQAKQLGPRAWHDTFSEKRREERERWWPSVSLCRYSPFNKPLAASQREGIFSN